MRRAIVVRWWASGTVTAGVASAWFLAWLLQAGLRLLSQLLELRDWERLLMVALKAPFGNHPMVRIVTVLQPSPRHLSNETTIYLPYATRVSGDFAKYAKTRRPWVPQCWWPMGSIKGLWAPSNIIVPPIPPTDEPRGGKRPSWRNLFWLG